MKRKNVLETIGIYCLLIIAACILLSLMLVCLPHTDYMLQDSNVLLIGAIIVYFKLHDDRMKNYFEDRIWRLENELGRTINSVKIHNDTEIVKRIYR